LLRLLFPFLEQFPRRKVYLLQFHLLVDAFKILLEKLFDWAMLDEISWSKTTLAADVDVAASVEQKNFGAF
jgi:hypothetical protein